MAGQHGEGDIGMERQVVSAGTEHKAIEISQCFWAS